MINTFSIYFTPSGETIFIYNDSIAKLLKEIGKRKDHRIGVVESTDTGWIIHEGPITNKKIGPFEYKEEALSKEVELVEAYLDKKAL